MATGAPWAGTVTAFRLDPNQDAGARCWSIGRVWLTADEPAGAVLAPVVAAPSTPRATTKKTTRTTKPAKKTTRTTRR